MLKTGSHALDLDGMVMCVVVAVISGGGGDGATVAEGLE